MFTATLNTPYQEDPQPSQPVVFNLGMVFLGILLAGYAFLAWQARSMIRQGRSDFAIYYTASRMVADHQSSRLYDLPLQSKYQQRLLPELRFQDGLLPYNHPPFEVLWFLPLSGFSYVHAFLLWCLFNIGCFASGIWILSKSGDKDPERSYGLSIAAGFGFLPVFVALLQGQDSAMAFCFLAFAFRALKRGRDATAGLWLALMLQKFQLLPAFLLVGLIHKRWRLLAGFATGGIGLTFVSAGVVGWEGVLQYLRLIPEMTAWINKYGIYPAQMHCLRGQFYALWPGMHPWLVYGGILMGSLFLLALLVRSWKGPWEPNQPEFDLKFSLLVVVSLLISPHVNFHDLSMLLIPGILGIGISRGDLLSPSQAQRLQRFIIFAGFPITLATLPVEAWLRLKLSVAGMLMITILISRALTSLGIHTGGLTQNPRRSQCDSG